MAAGLRLICLLSALSLGTAAAVAAVEAGSNSTEGYSCDALAKVPAEQRCSFLKSSCPSESVVPYAQWYYCNVAHHDVVLRFFYVALVCCLLPLAFCLLGDTAEFYIAPIMAHVSQAIPKMRPRFAGVTFVALGNGAPDLSSNIAAISAGEVVLSAGALTGAAMFVQCIVAAELVSLAGPAGIKCGGAMLRDVGVYCLAIFSVLLAFTLGQISRAFVGWALALYIIYMVWVFAGDEWHQRGRPQPRLTAHSFKALLAGELPITDALALVSPAGTGAARMGQAGVAAGAGHTTRYSNSADGTLEESLLPWAVAEDEESTAPELDEAFFQQQQQQQQLGYFAGDFGRLSHLRTPSGLRMSSVTTELSDFGVQGGGSSLQGGGGSGLAASTGGGSSDSSSMQGLAPTARMGVGLTAVGNWTPAQTSSHTEASPHLLQRQQQSWQGHQQHLSLPGTVQGQQQQGPSSGSSSNNWGLDAHQQQQQQQQQHHHHHQHHQQQQQPHLLSLGNQNYIDAKTYKQLVWADLADDEKEEQQLERQIARQLLAATRRPARHSTGTREAGSYQPPVPAAASAGSAPVLGQHLPQDDISQRVLQSENGAGAPPQQQPFTAAAAAGIGQQQQQEPHDRRLLLSPIAPATHRTPLEPAEGQQQQQQQQQVDALSSEGQGDSWQQLQWQVTLGNSEEWEDAGAVRRWFRKVTFPLLLPAYLGQRLTIPFASAAGYSREWLIAALLCCPLAAIIYLGWLSLPAIFIASGFGIVAAGTAAVLTCWDAPGQMPVQGLGGLAAAVVPGVLAVLAFCMGVMWIDTVATEVVGVITFLAGLASLPSGVMGLTLLAWGNSLGDFFGNRAMAKAGHTSTAITACFAAPLFNMLISLSLGFSAYLHQLGTRSVRVQLTPEVALGCIFLMGYNMAIMCVGRLCGQRLPPWFAHFARVWYGLYFTLSVVSGFMNKSD